MPRKLASVRKVLEVIPIENADAIELARIDGWQCVVKKGEFKPGDLGMYFEIDSFLPIEPQYEFLRKSSFKDHPLLGPGFRLKTVRLRGALSQGLLMPLTIAGAEGEDLTERLGVRLYEPPMPASLAGDIAGSFPSLVTKTDAERIQNLPEFFTTHKDMLFEVTEKLDGSSCTILWEHGQMRVCSRNWELKEDEKNTFWKVAFRILPGLLAQLNHPWAVTDFALQGEVVGEGIQGNPLKIAGHKFFLFNVYDLTVNRYMYPRARNALLSWLRSNGAEIDHVPIIEMDWPAFTQLTSMDLMLEYADGKSLVNPNVDREGLVFKSQLDPNIIFKAISNKHLLKQKD